VKWFIGYGVSAVTGSYEAVYIGVKRRMPMDTKFSIIIPTFNNTNALLLTLTSLELQTFPMDRFEVIVVDDGTFDDATTEAIKNYNPQYKLIYISNNSRQGRAHTRNVGAKSAQGKYLVFLDADFLVVPEFLNTLSTYHHRYPEHVISGFPESLRSVFAQYYPQFSERKKNDMRQILEPNGLWRHYWLTGNRIADVLTPGELRLNFDKIRSAVIPLNLGKSYDQEIRSTDVAPWIMFITRCVSLQRKHFMEVGGFEERFIAYGFEDWELGYRLHKHGLSYQSVNGIIGYHQKHPSTFRQDDPKHDNLRIFYDIHGSEDPELSLLSLLHPLNKPSLYKKTLRVLEKWRITDKEMEQTIKNALNRAARAFIKSNY
jgi:GT2 family glycosyltransferase